MKKVLIITYYWPPAGGPGVQRALYFVKYLRDFGWEPVVYTVENGEFHNYDQSFEQEIPHGVEILKTKAIEPYHWYKKLMGKKKEETLKPVIFTEQSKKPWLHRWSVWIRGNFFIPDARMLWIQPSVKYLKDYLSKHPVDIIFSTSPPQSMHLIGLKLKEQLGIPWVADFRDPWTRVSYYKDLKLTKWADQKHKKLERKVLQSADRCVAVGWTMKRDFESLGGRSLDVVTNGYDYSPNPSKETEPSNEKLRILYLGSLSRKRNPIFFWTALAELIHEKDLKPSDIQLQMVGNIEPSIYQSLDELQLQSFYTSRGYIPHEEVWSYYEQADILLLIGIPNQPEILPGKLFEYLVSQKPILAIFPKHSDVEHIIVESKSGLSADFEEKEKLKSNIEQFIHLYQKKQLQSTYGNRMDRVKKYARKNLTGQLAQILNEVVDRDH